MRMYCTISKKASEVIDFFRQMEYEISKDTNLYKPYRVCKLDEAVEELGIIIVIRRPDAVEVAVPNSVAIDPDNMMSLWLSDPTARTSVTDRHITKRVLDSLKKGGIHNPPLLRDLEAQSSDPVSDSIEPNEMFILEKKCEPKKKVKDSKS